MISLNMKARMLPLMAGVVLCVSSAVQARQYYLPSTNLYAGGVDPRPVVTSVATNAGPWLVTTTNSAFVTTNSAYKYTIYTNATIVYTNLSGTFTNVGKVVTNKTLVKTGYYTNTVKVVTNDASVTVKWSAFGSSAQVQASTNSGTSWLNIGAAVSFANYLGSYRFATNAVTKNATGYRVSVSTPVYNGAGSCGRCHLHATTTADWMSTPHADAFEALVDLGEQTNSACLACHTTGYGLSTGYATNKAWLAGVQCENCHGPSMGHAGKANTPAVTLDSKTCGGCHNGYNPQYDEWSGTPHGKSGTSLRYAEYYTSNSLSARWGRIGQCGPCHAAGIRLAMMKVYPTNGLASLNTNAILAAGTVNCAFCHDPHAEHIANGGVHLRFPIYSTNAASWYTDVWTNLPPYTNTAVYKYGANLASNVLFASLNHSLQSSNVVGAFVNPAPFDQNTMVCGQCHIARNTDLGRFIDSTPHHSHQYNINSATIGFTTNEIPEPDRSPTSGTSMQHGINTNGATCTLCHMTGAGEAEHTFEVTTNGCYASGCHDPMVDPDMETKIADAQANISNQMFAIAARLNAWGDSNPGGSTNAFGIGHGTVSKPVIEWEYYSSRGIGEISASPAGGSSTNQTPTAADMAKIPLLIKQARYNLYLLKYDKSYGVHNPQWAQYLLDCASNNVTIMGY